MATRDKSTQNQEKPEHFSPYIVIPSEVFFDSGITPRAKLLYGLLSCMTNYKNYCWARNSTLSKYLSSTEGKSVSDSTVRRLLKDLKDRGYIRVELGEDNGATGREIYVPKGVAAMPTTPLKNEHPPDQKQAPTPLKNEHQNNNMLNNIPPIVPPEGDATATAKKQRKRKPPTGTVELPPELEESFMRFWDTYPQKKDKQNARLRWLQLNPDEELVVSILDSIRKLKGTEDWKRDIIPLPSTFLNNRRWEDAEGLPDPEPESEEGGNVRWL